MAFSLRIPPALEADARARAERLGISLNALLCVALDAYLRGPEAARPVASAPLSEPATPHIALPPEPAPAPVPVSEFPVLSRAERRRLEREKKRR